MIKKRESTGIRKIQCALLNHSSSANTEFVSKAFFKSSLKKYFVKSQVSLQKHSPNSLY